MKKNNILTAIFSISLLSVTACDNNSSQDSPTTIQEEKFIKDLSVDEMNTICNEATQDFNQALGPDKICLYNGILSGSLAAIFGGDAEKTKKECQSAYDTCKQNGEGSSFTCVLNQESIKDCPASVKEFKTCYNEQIKAISTALAEFNCSSDFTVKQTSPEEIPSCTLVEEKCPGLKK